MGNEQLAMSNEQWILCSALRQKGLDLNNASIISFRQPEKITAPQTIKPPTTIWLILY